MNAACAHTTHATQKVKDGNANDEENVLVNVACFPDLGLTNEKHHLPQFRILPYYIPIYVYDKLIKVLTMQLFSGIKHINISQHIITISLTFYSLIILSLLTDDMISPPHNPATCFECVRFTVRMEFFKEIHKRELFTVGPVYSVAVLRSLQAELQ